MLTGEMKSACQIRTLYGMPCDRCKYNSKCSAYKNQLEKEGKENVKKKQRSRRSKNSSQ